MKETDFFRHEIENRKSIEEKLEKELFNVRISNSSKINDQEENILDLERHIRKLESENSHLSAAIELRNRQVQVGIDRVDHQRIILQIQNKFRNEIKQIEINETKLNDQINQQNQGNTIIYSPPAVLAP